MLYTNFERLNGLGELLNDFNHSQVSSIIANKDYIQLTKIEYKYYDLIEKAKNLADFSQIKKELAVDFGQHEVLTKYVEVICKEKYLTTLYQKLHRNTFIKAFKIQILTQLFIATIRYGEKIFNKPSFRQLEEDAIITNFRLYIVMINPFYLYRYLGILSFQQARILKRLLNVEISWDVDHTFDYLMIKENNLFPLKIFNLEKEIIKENTEDIVKERREYGMLVYHTYVKLFIAFISENMLKTPL